MTRTPTLLLAFVALLSFAGNSLLCRLALKHTGIDPASFTSVRIFSGALTLWLITRIRTSTGSQSASGAGNWPSALALFVYAAAFSYAYVSLTAATGALLLFGAVQATMIGYAVWLGERLLLRQWLGLLCAFAGLADLLLPGLSSPPAAGAALMLSAGVAWGVYSLRGKAAGDPTRVTAGNFLRAAPMAALLSLATVRWSVVDLAGLGYALASGALASGVGYAVWYTALRGLKATSAATLQLSVPVLAALGGVVFLGESVTQRLLLASAAILGGIALVMARPAASKPK
jgi:drug/metabolite transporter (DMT)-like permease